MQVSESVGVLLPGGCCSKAKEAEAGDDFFGRIACFKTHTVPHTTKEIQPALASFERCGFKPNGINRRNDEFSLKMLPFQTISVAVSLWEYE